MDTQFHFTIVGDKVHLVTITTVYRDNDDDDGETHDSERILSLAEFTQFLQEHGVK